MSEQEQIRVVNSIGDVLFIATLEAKVFYSICKCYGDKIHRYIKSVDLSGDQAQAVYDGVCIEYTSFQQAINDIYI